MAFEIEERTLQHLKKLISINTSNPPGNESEAVAYISDVLKQVGIQPVVIEPQKGRGNCIVRLKGKGEKGGLLLNSHLDVVPAGNEKAWRNPPFSAADEGGFIWGRGAVDMKHMAAMMLAIVEEISLKGVAPRGDIVFVWTADEERGGECGARYLVQKHRDLLEAEYGIGEVGGFGLSLGGKTFIIVQTAEKGLCWFRLRTAGLSGHGSMPDPESSVAKISRAIAALSDAKLPVHSTRTFSMFLESVITKAVPGPVGKFGKMAISAKLLKTIMRRFPNSKVVKGLWPMMANTVAVTMLEAGDSPNVIPQEATAVVDGRYLPGQTREGFLSEVTAVIGKDVDIEIIQEGEPFEVSSETELFRIIQETVERFEPRMNVVPFLNPGFTDGKWFSKLGIIWYGFTPLIGVSPEGWSTFETIHAVNERVPVELVKKGSRVLLKLIESWMF